MGKPTTNDQPDGKRFYREGRKVMDREKSSHGGVYCEARSNHAAEVIQLALNSWHGMGPSRTLPIWIKKRIAKRKRKSKSERWERKTLYPLEGKK
jgi:hypothetical protein